MERFAPYDWGGLALALLLGIKDNLDTDLASSYKSAGCSHVLALSGMHLAIVSGLLAFFLKKPLGLRAAAITGGVFIVAYVFLIGLQPSLVRSAIMYLLGALAVLGSLPKRPSLLLALAFLIQLALWPSSGNSLSFILSYLALGGILVLGGAFHFLLQGKVPEMILQPFSASVGAFIATAPVMAAFFGIVQLVGILAGLIVVPLTTLFMIAAMAAPILSSLVPPLGRAADFLLSWLYQILEKITAAASLVPSPPASRWQAVLLISLGLLALILFIHYRENFRSKSLAPFNAG
jgi:competence protein ComEC